MADRPISCYATYDSSAQPQKPPLGKKNGSHLRMGSHIAAMSRTLKVLGLQE